MDRFVVLNTLKIQRLLLDCGREGTWMAIGHLNNALNDGDTGPHSVSHPIHATNLNFLSKHVKGRSEVVWASLEVLDKVPT